MYHYRECGLDNVWLRNGYKEHDTPYGKGVSITNVEGLLDVIALHLVQKEALLTGKELRFLRVQMGLSQKELGELQGVSAQMVSLWERKNSLPLVNDRWVRVQYLSHADADGNMKKIISKLMAKVEAGEADITVKRTSGEWKSSKASKASKVAEKPALRN